MCVQSAAGDKRRLCFWCVWGGQRAVSKQPGRMSAQRHLRCSAHVPPLHNVVILGQVIPFKLLPPRWIDPFSSNALGCLLSIITPPAPFFSPRILSRIRSIWPPSHGAFLIRWPPTLSGFFVCLELWLCFTYEDALAPLFWFERSKAGHLFCVSQLQKEIQSSKDRAVFTLWYQKQLCLLKVPCYC